MRGSDAFLYFIVALYAVSLALAFQVGHSFFVLGAGELLILGVGLFIGPIVVGFLLINNIEGGERFGVVVAHIFLAVLFHPETTLTQPLHLDTAEQFELLRRVSDYNETWWVTADAAYDLARSLKASALLNNKISSPLFYWAFPPSLALVFWGIVLFFVFPRNRESS